MLTRQTVENTIGKTFADKLDEYVIDVSSELSFTRREMVEELGCANFLAASRLRKVLKRLKITTITGLYRTDPYSLLRVKGVGEATIFVVMCILATKKYDVEKWWGWNDTNDLKFGAFKHRAIQKRREKTELGD